MASDEDAAVDEIQGLIDRSSLGSEAARSLRARTDMVDVNRRLEQIRIRQASMKQEERPVGETAAPGTDPALIEQEQREAIKRRETLEATAQQAQARAEQLDTDLTNGRAELVQVRADAAAANAAATRAEIDNAAIAAQHDDLASALRLIEDLQTPPENGNLAEDQGIFGSASITWRIHSDPLAGLAVLRSLALRVLHPEGLSSVFATAQRVDDPWDRLRWTLRHLGLVTFGSDLEAAMAAARLRAVLMQVNGVTSDGQMFRGDDPDQLLWTHCCQVASLVEVTRRGGLDLTDAEHEAYIREQQRMAAAFFGLELDTVPGTRRELVRYFRSVRSHLRMTAAGRLFMEAIVNPVLPELMVLAQRNRPQWAPVAGLAFGALPSWARRMYTPLPITGPAGLSQSAVTVALHALRVNLGKDTNNPDIRNPAKRLTESEQRERSSRTDQISTLDQELFRHGRLTSG